MLITLMLMMALITIALLAAVPEIGQQLRRDREEELEHRGTAYMRAIQHFYKKFGRYPTRIEDLENTNNVRFLRKRYKDPMNRDPATGKERDFRLLHQTDIILNTEPLLNQGIGGSVGQPRGVQPTTSAGAEASAGGDSGDPSSAETDPNSPEESASAETSSESGSDEQTVFGGGSILGVASTSKAKSIRMFYEKNYYNEWFFVFVPDQQRGPGLLTGPVNPSFPNVNLNGVPPAQTVSGQGQGQGLIPNGGQTQVLPVQPSQNQDAMPPEQ